MFRSVKRSAQRDRRGVAELWCQSIVAGVGFVVGRTTGSCIANGGKSAVAAIAHRCTVNRIAGGLSLRGLGHQQRSGGRNQEEELSHQKYWHQLLATAWLKS